ncbi:MAG: DNA repair protein RecO [Firmicutes bacterium]|nr:DNA repair protein RecO [Bacillota bacterium]
MGLYRTDAVVLRTYNLGEADKILTLFTQDKGKVRAVARGSRRPRNHLISSSQPFVRGTYMIFQRKNLDSISQAAIIDPMMYLREDLTKMAYASYMVELVDQLTEEYDPNEGLFRLLIFALTELKNDGLETKLLPFFELHVLRQSGVGPELDCCVACGKSSTGQNGEPLGFSFREGGILCRPCLSGRTDAVPISPGALKIMLWLADAEGEKLKILQIPSSAQMEIERVLQGSIDYYLQKPLKSLEFLHIMRQ